MTRSGFQAKFSLMRKKKYKKRYDNSQLSIQKLKSKYWSDYTIITKTDTQPMFTLYLSHSIFRTEPSSVTNVISLYYVRCRLVPGVNGARYITTISLVSNGMYSFEKLYPGKRGPCVLTVILLLTQNTERL